MKIYLCTTATSKKYKSWSNIPYLLHKNFESKGYKVKNLVLRELEPIKFLFNLPVRVLIKFFGLKTTYYYVRTPLHFFSTYLCSQFIRFTSKDNDVMFVQGFSYPSHNTKNKMFIIGDWPSSYLFDNFLKRKPSKMEMKSVAREDLVIESADAVVTLYPDVHKYMLNRYQNKNIYYFGNVVNIDAEVTIPLDILTIKKNTEIFYPSTASYTPRAESGILFSDESIGIEWPLQVTDVSGKDLKHEAITKEFKGIIV
jgi:hypothetical protein